MEQKIEKYVQELLSQKVGELNDENGSILIDLIKYIYNDADILMFAFPFLDKIDDFLVRPENLDIIKKLFRIIKKENSDFDIITSGNFGEWIYQIIDSGKIDFDGNVVVMNGKIRNMEGEKKNPVEIIKKKYDISNKKFIFVDDSYFSGETKNNIDNFLKKYNSGISKTYVFYTHKNTTK